MSTTLTTTATWYRVGARYGMDGSLGYDNYPLTGRFKFHTPSTGATSFRFTSSAYNVYGGTYQFQDPGFHWLVTSESSGYESKVGTDVGTSAQRVGDSMTGAASIDLMPDTDYYLWIWPNSTLYSRISPGTITVTVDGVYGTPSTISASDGSFGTAIAVRLETSTQGALHTLQVSCAGRTETLLTKSSATSCVWTPELETYAPLLPDAGSAEAVFRCETFYGENSVGTETSTIIVSFPAGSLAPEVSDGWAAAAPYNTGEAAGFTVFIQGYSAAEIRFDEAKIACKYGATITGYRIRCAGVSADESPFRTQILTGSAEILCTVTDSRGQESSETLNVTVQPYAEPRITEVSVFRCNSAGEAADDGQYYSARGRVIFSTLSGENNAALTVAAKLSTEGSYGTETQLTNNVASVIGGLLPDRSYEIRMLATDGLSKTATVTVAIATQRWAMKFRPDGMGVGFGKAPEHANSLELPADWVIRIGDTVISGGSQ